MAGNLIISTINGQAIGVKNAIINGNFAVNQRGVSGTVVLSAGAYGHDRWKAGASGCTYTFATSANVTTITITAGSLIQVIEGVNLYTDTYTLSWSGTAQGKIGAGSYSGSGVTGSVTGGSNLNIEFNTGTLSLVQLEAGTVASPFERRDYGRELMMCQRYCYSITAETGQTPIIGMGLWNSGTDVRIYVPMKVTMRTTPTTSLSSASHFQALYASVAWRAISSVASVTESGVNGVSLLLNTSGSGSQGQGTELTTASSSALMLFTAEL